MVDVKNTVSNQDAVGEFAPILARMRRNRRCAVSGIIVAFGAICVADAWPQCADSAKSAGILGILCFLGCGFASALGRYGCPRCTHDIRDFGPFCPQCGAPDLTEETWRGCRCEACRKYLAWDKNRRAKNFICRFCSHCGVRLHDKGF